MIVSNNYDDISPTPSSGTTPTHSGESVMKDITNNGGVVNGSVGVVNETVEKLIEKFQSGLQVNQLVINNGY